MNLIKEMKIIFSKNVIVQDDEKAYEECDYSL